jgi:hypothetical protein
MGMMDDMKNKAREAIEKNRDKIDQGMHKAAELANEKTGGKHSDKIDGMVERGKGALDKLDEPGQGDQPSQPNQSSRPNQSSQPGPPTPPTPPTAHPS